MKIFNILRKKENKKLRILNIAERIITHEYLLMRQLRNSLEKLLEEDNFYTFEITEIKTRNRIMKTLYINELSNASLLKGGIEKLTYIPPFVLPSKELILFLSAPIRIESARIIPISNGYLIVTYNYESGHLEAQFRYISREAGERRETLYTYSLTKPTLMIKIGDKIVANIKVEGYYPKISIEKDEILNLDKLIYVVPLELNIYKSFKFDGAIILVGIKTNKI